ncbi:hypothetical protein ACQI4L_03465 [Mycolicibacterium litorale]|uniref:hypothetical protein n=1 Tax=Mycolicibacterium litorale TaxID=758802 RepID=UPI003CF68B5C
MNRVLAGSVAIAAVALGVAPPAPAQGPAPHQVRYTVTADEPIQADVYYRAVDPPTWADYSHNPYQFSPKAEVVLDPGSPWVLEVALVDPNRWAMVTATSGLGPERPNLRCELAVDGVVVATHSGPKGALCSLRSW